MLSFLYRRKSMLFLFMYSFTIKVEAMSDESKAYAIIFDSREAVENIQKYYKKYDEMIADLDYDEQEDSVKFNNTDKSELNCVSVYYFDIMNIRNVLSCLLKKIKRKKKIIKITTMENWSIMNQKRLKIRKKRKKKKRRRRSQKRKRRRKKK